MDVETKIKEGENMEENNVLDFFGCQLRISNGEMHRLRDASGNESEYYVALGSCLGHNIFFNYTCVNSYELDYIAEIINGLPEFASNYLLDVMQNNNNLLIYLTRYIDEDSCYDIYYNFDGDDLSIDGLVNWMQLNNDFAAINYRYTEIKNGKQSIPE